MHLIENQYFNVITTKHKNTIMHDLKAIYTKVRTSILATAKHCFVYGENHRFYPNPPKMSDLEVISLAITAECLEIDSENLLWAKLKKDYADLFPTLSSRTRYNIRRKQLSSLIQDCLDSMADFVDAECPSATLIVDSIPIPTCSIVREKTSTVCRVPERDELVAAKTFNPIFKNYYIGYKLHLICSDKGVYRDFMITPANVHDNAYLKSLTSEDHHLNGHNLLGDRAYVGQALQLHLFEELKLNVQVPYRRNQRDYRQYSVELKIKRKTIEVVFAQYCDEFRLRKNYAKRFEGLFVRLQTKITAKTFKQYWNVINGNPINQTKHALAA